MDEHPIDVRETLAPLRVELDARLGDGAGQGVAQVRADGLRRRRRRNVIRGAALSTVAVFGAVGAVALATRGGEERGVDTIGTIDRTTPSDTTPSDTTPSDTTPSDTPLPFVPSSVELPTTPGTGPTIRVITSDGASDFVGVPFACAAASTGPAASVPPACTGGRDGFIGSRQGTLLKVQLAAPAEVRVAALPTGNLLPPDRVADQFRRMQDGEGALTVLPQSANDPRRVVWTVPIELAPGSYRTLITVTFDDGTEVVAYGTLPVAVAAGDNAPQPGSSALLAESPQRCAAIPIRPTTDLPRQRRPGQLDPVGRPDRQIGWTSSTLSFAPWDLGLMAGPYPAPSDGEEIEVLGRRAVVGQPGDVVGYWQVSIAWDQRPGECDMTITLFVTGSREKVDQVIAGLREVAPIVCPVGEGEPIGLNGSAEVRYGFNEWSGTLVEGTTTFLSDDGACPAHRLQIGGVDATVIIEDPSPS